MNRTFVGFGLGAIQSGLFLAEARKSGNFSRLVVAEVVPEIVAAVRETGGYWLNVATASGTEQRFIDGIEIYNPTVEEDAKKLVAALAEAQEIGTALPSVDFFVQGAPSVADLLRQASAKKLDDPSLPNAVVYTAENNNHAAETLNDAVGLDLEGRVQFLNTVVGKMSGVVVDEKQINEDGLSRVTPTADRAFLVEEFNRILIERIGLPGFQRGIKVFEEKEDLLPFEEAKLYGHNAAHALIGYLAHEEGCRYMSEVAGIPGIMETARAAFLNESGAALVHKYGGLDPLFTEKGFRAYAEDLLRRMTNPWLRDQVERIIRDPERKLGWDDRLIGTMRLALEHGIRPVNFAKAAAVAASCLAPDIPPTVLLARLWSSNPDLSYKPELLRLIADASKVWKP